MPSSETQHSSPPPQSSQSTSDSSPPPAASRILLDPNIHPQPFDLLRLMDRYEEGKKEDEDEVEAIFAQLEEVAEEFTIWSYSRVKIEDERSFYQLERTSQEIAAEEEKQEHHRSKIASFLASFKSALALLTG